MGMKETKQYKFWLNSIFWILSYLVLFRLFTKEYYNGTVDYIYTIIFHIPLFLIVAMHLISIDKYLIPKKYLHYLTSFIILFFLGIITHYLVLDNLAPIFIEKFYFISMPLIEISQYIIAYLLISLLFALSRNWFELRENQLLIERENNKTLLNNLKAQLNPHFLFNSLNNIYSITGKENKEARNYIIKLSDALRYMLYKTSSDTVPLKDEIEYLENYIGLEKLRLESDSNVEFTKANINDKLNIAPLILLPLIENCFKHCNKPNAIIKIDLSTYKNKLVLICENNKSENNYEDGGIGLINSKKRLELIYPNRFTLKINDSKTMYKSKLNLEL